MTRHPAPTSLRTALALALLWAPEGARAQTAPQVQISGPQAYGSDRPLTAGMTTYSVAVDGNAASLRMFRKQNTLIFSVDTAGHLLSPATLARSLEPLLGAVLRDHPDTARFHILFRDRDAMLDRLRQILAASPSWDSRRGRPVHGTLRRFLVATINQNASVFGAVKDVFKTTHYELKLSGVGLVSIGPVAAFGGKLLPIDIARMDFVAVKF